MRIQGYWVQAQGHPVGQGGGRRALLNLLLGVQAVGSAALLLVSIDRAGVQAEVILAAGHLVTVVLVGELVEGGLDEATP